MNKKKLWITLTALAVCLVVSCTVMVTQLGKGRQEPTVTEPGTKPVLQGKDDTQTTAAVPDLEISISETEPERPATPETQPVTIQPQKTEQTVPETTVPQKTAPDAAEPEATKPKKTKPAATEPETIKPTVTEPVVTEPLVTEPAVTEPTATEPLVTEPEVTEPEVTEPEITEPEVTEPEVTEPEITEPEITEPEITEPEITEPEITEPEITEPEVTEPERQEPKAKNVTVYDANGNPVQLSNYFGKPIVLNFWASWCGPCKREMPAFQDAYRELGSQVHFLMVNMTGYDTLSDAQSFISQSGYTFPVLYDLNSDAADTYHVTAFPTTYFIDAQGYVMAKAVGAMSADTLRNYIDLIR